MSPDDELPASLPTAVAALDAGETVIYPTETVYGLAAAATDPAAVKRVFALKDRPRSKPLSVAFPDQTQATAYTTPTDREQAFMREFLPGPVTVLVERRGEIPPVVTAHQPTVGVRIPDHAVARELARRAGPITATSANRSGSPSVRTVSALSDEIRNAVGAIIDTGETPGNESTVVDVEAGEIHRRGALAAEIESWLAEH